MPARILHKAKRGDGEAIGGVIIMAIICSMSIYLGSFLTVTSSLSSLSKAANVAGRTAAVCCSMDEAEERAELAAVNSITSTRLEDIEASVEYAGGTSEWEPGGYLKVTVSAYVHTMGPATSGRREQSVIVSIEDSGSAY